MAALVTALRANSETLELDGGRTAVVPVNSRGEWHGAYVEKDAEGRVLRQCHYRKGLRHGTDTRYHANGEKRMEGQYRHGRKEGVWEVFDEVGDVTVTYRWKKGQMIEGPEDSETEGRTVGGVTQELQKIFDAQIKGDFDKDHVMGLKRWRAYRYLCRIPHEDCVLSEEDTALAQLAAEINDALGTGLTHTPKNPGWPEDKYQRAALGARSCSLDFGKGMTAVEVVDSLMDDSDMTNVDRMGHRRNLLNPRSQKTGFGNEGSIQAMYAVDQSGPRFKGHFVAFPPPGPIPVAFIHSEENEGIAWTFSMNPKFLSCPKSGFKVKVFELDAMNDRVRVLDTKLVSRSSFGNLYPAVIFRPVGLEVAPGKKYRVEIWGLHAGRDVEVGPGGEVAYTVSFFEMKDPFARYYINR